VSARFLGYQQRRPWLWTVDLDTLACDPTATRLPGNDIAISSINIRRDWLAVHTHQVVWAIPRTLDAPGRRLRRSFRCVPRPDGETIWTDAADTEPLSGEFEAIDSSSRVIERLSLGSEGDLLADLPSCLIIERADRAIVVDRDGDQQVVWPGPSPTWFLGATPQYATFSVGHEIWVHGLETGTTVKVSHPSIAKWGMQASTSPDGGLLAVAGRRADDARRVDDYGFTSSMAVIDLSAGELRVAPDSLANFAWSPAWTSDGAAVVFGTPFERRRLRRLTVHDMVTEVFRFRVNPVMPMLDVDVVRSDHG
jgi:hypothetical protein